jgi:DNA polymerase delta subunit 3
MQGMSEDEGDDDEPEIQVDTEKIEAAKKARDERAEKLRKMMEDDGKLVSRSCLHTQLTGHR